jgi:hypothetical protein
MEFTRASILAFRISAPTGTSFKHAFDQRQEPCKTAFAIDDRGIAFKIQYSAPMLPKKKLQVLEKRQ